MMHVNLTPFLAQLGHGFNFFNPKKNVGLAPAFVGDKARSGTDHGLAAGEPSAASLASPVQLGPESSGKILDRQVISSLANALQSEGISLPSAEGQDFSPGAVAGRVLSAVQGFLEQYQQDNPGAATDEFFAQVRAGVEQGFNEARNVLADLGILTGDVKENIDATHGLVQQGLDRLQNPTPAPAADGDNGVGASTAGALFASVEKSQTTSIQIETREGDIVTIDIFKKASADTTAAVGMAGGDRAAYVERNVSASAGLSYSVQGDLNEDELKAIGKLLGRVDKVADRFFNGNINAAFKQANKLGFDTEQLASFSVDLQQSRTVQVAAAYGQTAPATVPTVADAVGFISDLQGLLKDDTANALFADPLTAIGDLFKGVSAFKLEGNPIHHLEKNADNALKNVVDELTGMFKGLTDGKADLEHVEEPEDGAEGDGDRSGA